MTEQTLKTWEVILATGDVKIVSGTHALFNPDTFSVTFYNGENVVGAFLNFHNFSEVS